MIFDSSSSTHLKPWLIRTLEPICDAEPGALADYILALLKHNVPETEMRNELAVQLDEFLEKAECSTFIDTLFTVLRTKSYLPYSASSPSSFPSKNLDVDPGIPIPLDGLLSPSLSTSSDRNLKRSSDSDERDERPPAKGPRLSSEGQFSRYSNHQGGRGQQRSTGGWRGQMEGSGVNGYGGEKDAYVNEMGMSAVMGMAGLNRPVFQMNGRRQQVYQPPDQRRGICRDYHNSGYCARGAMCKYSHGEDAVVPGLYPMNGAIPIPFMPMFAGANPFGFPGIGAAYDPHEARMDMRPIGGNRPQRAPLLPRIQQEVGGQVIPTHASGELPVIQDLTPANSEIDKSHRDSLVQPQLPLAPLDQHPVSSHPELYGSTDYSMQNETTNGQASMPTNSPIDTDLNHRTEMGPPKAIHNNFRGRGGNRGRGGLFGGDAHSSRPERRNDKTLVVEKIPEDKLSLDQVNGWFKRFGTVTNVAIDSSNAKALISFSNHDEAYAAWKSEDAVFGNRFVKVFWHRPMEGHGQVGAKLLAASAPLVAGISNKSSPTTTSSKATSIPKKPSTSSSSSTSSLALKQQLLEKQITEQKSLMASLDTASGVEKKAIMARLRKLGEEMELTPVSTTAPLTIPQPDPSNVGITSREEKERERLDKELEMHNASAVRGEDGAEALKLKLEKLQAEAASLGIADSGTEPFVSSGYRPYRGRGRGTRGYRGVVRGGPPPRASMKLDNRPKKLLIKGVQQDGVQVLRDWFETIGQVDNFETSETGDIIVSFKSRAAAEQGLSKGNNVPTIGPVQMAWFTGKNTSTSTSSAVLFRVARPDASDIALKDDDAPRLRSQELAVAPSPRPQEEEVIDSGWGEDGDGEDGMGML